MRHNIASLAETFVTAEKLVTATANNNFHITNPAWSRRKEVLAALDSWATTIAERRLDGTFGVNTSTYGSSYTGRHRNAVMYSLEEAGYVKTGETYEIDVWYMHSRQPATFEVWAKPQA